MNNFQGLTLGLSAVLGGAAGLPSGLPPAISSALILIGLGIGIRYERKVNMEASTALERKASAVYPALAELGVIAGIAYASGFYELGLIYLGAVLLKTEVFTGFDEASDFSRSRLLGRMGRMLVLSLGVLGAEFNSFVLFYGLVGAGLVALYDVAVIVAESSSGI